MRGKSVPEYMASLMKPQAAAITLSEADKTPEKLDVAHDTISKLDIELAESRLNGARSQVKLLLDGDRAVIDRQVKRLALSPAAAHKLLSFSERARAMQLVSLAEGDLEMAASGGANVDDVMGGLDALPAKDPAPPAGDPVPDPKKPPAEAGDFDSNLEKLAMQIQKENPGMKLEDAYIQAEQQLSSQGTAGASA